MQHSTSKESQLIFRIYSIYKLLLSPILLALFFFTQKQQTLGFINSQIFIGTLCIYFILNTIELALHNKAFFNRTSVLFITFVLDIIVVTLCAQTSGGTESTISVLYLITISAATILLSGTPAFAIAAIATIALLTSSGYLFLQGIFQQGQLFQAGLLGILNFTTAIIIYYLANRLRSSQVVVERSVAEAEKLLQLNQQIVQRMRTGIIVASKTNAIQFMNQSAREMFFNNGYYTPTSRELAPALVEQLSSWRRNENFVSKPFRIASKGLKLQANFSALEPDKIEGETLIFIEDARALAQRAQQLKLASLGRLTASIAHEIRNPLGAISHANQLLHESKDITSADARLLEIIDKHSARVNEIIENILQLSRRENTSPDKFDISNWLKAMVLEYQQGYSHNADINIEISPGTHIVQCDQSQLRQILVNLFDNGLRYSKKSTGSEKILVKIKNNTDNLSVSLEIIDFGQGVPKESRNKLFEPFFTTESAGTGLGLYLCKELCESNHIEIQYLMNEENMSCFTLGFSHPDKKLWLEQ